MQAAEEDEHALVVAESSAPTILVGETPDSFMHVLGNNLQPLLLWILQGRGHLTDDDFDYALEQAAEYGNTDAIRVLWKELSNERKECYTVENRVINTRNGSPLGWAVTSGMVGSVRYLRDECSVSVNHYWTGDDDFYVDRSGTPLSRACDEESRLDEAGTLQMCRMLIEEYNADPNLCLEQDGKSLVCDALPKSISRGMVDVVRFLLDSGADPNMDRGCDEVVGSVAADAICLGQPDMLRLLLDRGLVVDEPTIQVERKTGSALYCLVENCPEVTDEAKLTIIRMLMEDAESNKYSALLLHLALEEAMDDAVASGKAGRDPKLYYCKMFFEAGMDPKMALYRAIRQGKDEYCRLLAEHWVDPFQEASENNSTNDGTEEYASSPVHEAARREDTRILQIFLDHLDKPRSSSVRSDHLRSILRDPEISSTAADLLDAVPLPDANPTVCKRLSGNKIEKATTKKDDDDKPEVMHAYTKEMVEQRVDNPVGAVAGATTASTALAATVNAAPAVEPLDSYDDMPALTLAEDAPPKNGIWLLVPASSSSGSRHDDRVELHYAYVHGSHVKAVPRGFFPKGSTIVSAQEGIIWVYAPSTASSSPPNPPAVASARASSTTTNNNNASWDLHCVRDINSTVTMYTVSQVGAESASLVVDGRGAAYLLLPTDPSNVSTCDRTLFRFNSQYEKGKQILGRLVPCHSHLYRDRAGGVWVHVPKKNRTSMSGDKTRTNEDSEHRLSPGIWYITPFAAVCVVSQVSPNVLINVDGSRTGLLLLSPNQEDDDDKSSTSLLVHIGSSGELHRRTIPVNFANVQAVLDDGDNGALVHCRSRNDRWKLCRVPWEDSSALGQGVADDELEEFIDCPRRTKAVTDGEGGVWLWKKVGKSSNRAVSYVSPSGKLPEKGERFPSGSVMEG